MAEAPGLPVKIGISANVEYRLLCFQMSTWREIFVCWTVPARPSHEGALKSIFRSRRTHGEWFTDPDDEIKHLFAGTESEADLAAIIGGLALAYDTPVSRPPQPRAAPHRLRAWNGGFPAVQS